MSMFKKWWNEKFASKKPCGCCGEEKTLSNAQIGEKVMIASLRGDKAVCQRLREMGFCEKAVVEKVADSGALICKVSDARIVISKTLAENIIVKDVGQDID